MNLHTTRALCAPACLLVASLAANLGAQTRVDLRTQSKSVDFSSAASTKPSQAGTTLPASCALGQTFLDTAAQPGQNLYICTATNTWTVQGANGLANYAMPFTSATTLTVPGSTHHLGTAKLFVEVYDTETPAVLVEPNEIQINPTTYDVTVTFASPQSGTLVLSAAGGGGGSAGPVTSVFGRLGTVAAQTGDYTAAQVTNAAQTNASNAFTAGTQDFSGATHTLPAKVGASANIPASCTTGEMYFATDAIAGQNWYYCTAANTWTPQVAGGGGSGGLADPGSNGIVARTATGTTSARVLTAGPGITVINGDGGSGNPTISLNTAVGLTNASAQADKPWFCNSTTGNTTYVCSLSAAAALTAYTTGLCVDLTADTSNTGAATLNIDGLGPKAIKIGDGLTDPLPMQIVAGRQVRICYDGSVFRLPTAVPLATVSLDGTSQGTYSALNFVTPVGLTWSLPPSGQTVSIAPQLDSAVVPSKTTANTYIAGAKQSMSPNTTTAGLNLSSGPLPSAPVTGDLAIDGTGNLNWFDGAAWRLGTVADTTLTAGVPVLGDGTNHVTAGSATGTGSVVMSIAPVIVSPVITSFLNANHDHSNSANGGAIANTAYAGPVPFSSLLACSSGIEGARGAVSDSTTNTWGATVTGGGSNHILAYCDGANWTVAAK
jgi:hypothetical protein